ncbi:MAG: radical SAM protein [Candidatus Diapherotrites archaeon]|nr:radical SAM protein [Candidatus Diapherotrites archaeon]
MQIKRLDLKLGFACNNNCLSCPQAHRRHLGDLTTAEVKKLLKEGREDGANEVVLTGGEPTVRPDIVEIVAYAKQLGYDFIQLQTNGRMLYYKDFCKKLIKAGVTEFAPAIHGPNARIHDYLVQSPGAFEQAVQGIKNLKELGQYIIMNSVINKINYKYLPETAKLFVDLNVDQYQFAFIHCVGNAKKNMDLLCPKKSEVMPYVHRALDIGIEAGIKVMVEAYPFCFMRGYEKYCSELYMPPAEIRDAEGVIENFDKLRKETGKLKGPQCKHCKYDLICEGPWREYPEKFGWSEFKPVPGPKVRDPKEILGEEEE